MEPHTKAKHDILRRYLQAWFPILSRYNGRIVYIDGFSGPGSYSGGEPGSPIVALDAAIEHRRALKSEVVFWFMDERADRIEHLRTTLSRREIPPQFRIHVECGTFDRAFGSALDALDSMGSAIAPTFVFIDPFGFAGAPFKLVERLFKHPKCEVFITFMVDSINRFIEHPNAEVVNRINEMFGTSDAADVAKTPENRIDRLRMLYQRELRKRAQFVRYFEMRTRDDRIQYYLFFATKNELGHLKMKEAMWRVDPDGAFRFSDATDPAQLVLFGSNVCAGLGADIRTRFRDAGETSGAIVRRYVENETAYLKKHMTEALKEEEKAGRLRVEATKHGGQARRKGTFPDDARLVFL
ncbi:MAG: three-Cys-motif partner protein TcmP [Planctomycetes bacterium]|nr:three-Cys-motif partner protein TcmP [Planctomycetota bacterium]